MAPTKRACGGGDAIQIKQEARYWGAKKPNTATRSAAAKIPESERSGAELMSFLVTMSKNCIYLYRTRVVRVRSMQENRELVLLDLQIGRFIVNFFCLTSRCSDIQFS